MRGKAGGNAVRPPFVCALAVCALAAGPAGAVDKTAARRIDEGIERSRAEVVKIRRFIHMNPELAGAETETAKLVAAKLVSLGLAHVRRVVLTRNRSILVSVKGFDLRVHEGFVDAPNAGSLLATAETAIADVLRSEGNGSGLHEPQEVGKRIQRRLESLFYSETRRRPVVVPLVKYD